MAGTPRQDIAARAEAGEARAQYLHAADLARAGKRDEAESWLQAAASGGEPDALYTLATRELKTLAGVGKAAELLAQAKGSAAATRLLAVLRAEGYGFEPDWEGAVASVANLAREGDPAAMREIAGLLILNDLDSESAAFLMQAAAETDPVAAAVICAQSAAGRTCSNRDAALRAAGRLGKLRYPHAEHLKRKIENAAPGRPPATANWEEVVSLVRKMSTPNVAQNRVLREPDVRMFEGAIPPELAEYIIARAAPLLAPSLTVDSKDGSVRRDAYRTSLTAILGPVDQDLVLIAVNRRIAALAGVDHQNAEFLSVLRYAPGDEYRPHYDWLPPGEDFDRGGQRIVTALLYLNDDYEGGETHFLVPDFKVKGKPGDLLVFANALPDGSGDKASRHAGLPVSKGQKWLGSKWFRERPYRF